MKLVTYTSYWIFSKFWINHSVLVCQWCVLSYELDYIFWPWVYKLYTKDVWESSIQKISHETTLPDITLHKYEGRRDKKVWCYEALEKILVENNIDMSKTINERTDIIIKRITIWLLYTIVILFTWALCSDFLLSFMYDTVYIDNIEELCQ